MKRNDAARSPPTVVSITQCERDGIHHRIRHLAVERERDVRAVRTGDPR
jgi:hypothetical protein